MTSGRIMVVNVGSSSLKLSVVERDGTVGHTSDVDCPDAIPPDAVGEFAREAGPVAAVGHRIVHGGAEFTEAVRLDPSVRARIVALAPLAPLHQGRSVAGIDAVAAALPELPAVACFDTAFHRTLPPEAHTYALPEQWRTRWGLRRYGFHGLSHAYAARRACEIVRYDPTTTRVVSCHLGAGVSIAAVDGGVSVDTTMGFTPAEGLVMATRAGDVDPAMIVWLQRQGVELPELERVLAHESGLAALAGHGGDMRAIRAAADAGEPRALVARRVYAYRLRTRIAAMIAAMGGYHVLAFTGGVGEHDDAIRADIVRDLRFIGLRLDRAANAAARGDAEIGSRATTARIVVVTAGEDVEIAAQTRRVLGPAPPAGRGTSAS